MNNIETKKLNRNEIVTSLTIHIGHVVIVKGVNNDELKKDDQVYLAGILEYQEDSDKYLVRIKTKEGETEYSFKIDEVIVIKPLKYNIELEVECETMEEKLNRLIEERLSALDVEEAFNEWLNNEYGDIEICGRPFDASSILYELDNSEYECQKHNWCEEECIEINGDYYDKHEVDEIKSEIGME